VKHTLGRLFGSMWSGLVTGLVIGVAVVVPVATDAQTSVVLAGSLRAANVTANDAEYKDTVSATIDQVVKLQVYYTNTSQDTANNVRVKFAMPEQAGAKQTVTATVKGSNSSEMKDRVTVSVDKEQAILQYIPGTAVWKHNTGSAEQPKFEETKISDEVVVAAQGIALENQKPGEALGSTVSVQAKVMVPGVKVIKESEVKGETNKWSANNSAKPGDTLRYVISYQNTSNAQQKQVVVRDVLPAKMQLVPGSTMLYNSSNSGGTRIDTDNIAAGGIVIGNYGPGANAYVIFEATFAPADQLACGNNEFRNMGYVRPEGMGEYFDSAVTTVKRECAATPPQQSSSPQPTPQPAPAYSCDLLTLTKGDGRKVSAKVDYTAKNGANLKVVSYNFGDGSQPLLTDKTTVEHAYDKDGTYTVSATLTVSANGKDQTSTSAACSKQVTFEPAQPAPTGQVGKDDLPNSGPGSIAALFVTASAVGFIVHRVLVSRWLKNTY
jgi:uncharacterized repeat protein (TIGR01451 family)